MARFLTRSLARVLTKVWGKEKTIHTVYSTTRPEEKILKDTKKHVKKPFEKTIQTLLQALYAQNVVLANLILVNYLVFRS